VREKDIKKLKLVNLTCEDCSDHNGMENSWMKIV